MSEEKKPKGRPRRVLYPKVRSIRLSDRDDERLTQLADLLETTEVEVIRLALRELAKARGVE